MNNNKFTDSEIKKALECCSEYSDCPHVCPLREMAYIGDCIQVKAKAALELINRQEAENESLKAEVEWLSKENDRLSQVVLYNDGVTEMKVEEAKAEAYNKFADRLKEIMCQENELYEKCVKDMLPFDYQRGYAECNDRFVWCIDNLYNELVGEDK